MSAWTIIRRSLGYFWRTHLGVVLGTALAAMVLTGSLFVGDSVKATLRRQAELRVGQVEAVISGGEHFFREELVGEIDTDAAPVLMLKGSVAKADGSARVNQAQVLGVDERFWKLGPHTDSEPPDFISFGGPSAVLNERLAAQLNAKSGDTLIIRLEKPGQFSKDAPLSGEESDIVALRVQVSSSTGPEGFGRFSLQANQVPPFSIFLPLQFLQERLQLAKRANLLLTGKLSPAKLRESLAAKWHLKDVELEMRPLGIGETELRTSRVFLDPAITAAAPRGRDDRRIDALTYFVNELRSGDKATPYSMVTAAEAPSSSFLPAELADDEIVISQWEADDLGITTGAKVTVKYFVMGERRQLVEKSREFTVLAILPMTEPQLNSSWMPDFPGLADKKNCRDWKPGFDFDATRMRDKDQQYWEQYRGTPKAFVNLKVGQEMWANRWGNLTSQRWPAGSDAAQIGRELLTKLTPEQLGFQFIPLREQALAATNAPVDFGELFVSFSFFLIAAAAVLTALLFVFSIEQRRAESGLLLALGWRPRSVQRLFLGEGAALAAIGSALGVVAALGYTRVVLRALATVWRGAVGSVEFIFAPAPATLATGLISGVLVALFAMWLASRRQFRHSARELMSGEIFESHASPARAQKAAKSPRPSKRLAWISAALLLAAIGCAAAGKSSPEAFFGAGSLLLGSALCGARFWLRHQAIAATPGLDDLTQLAARNAARRRGRSLTTIAVLASGVFMVVAVDSFRQRPQAETIERASGTGGFTLVAEAASPIYDDLNSEKGRENLGLTGDAMRGVSFVPMRLREGDDASCLNLNRAVQPRILGAKADDLASRGAFRFAAVDRRPFLGIDVPSKSASTDVWRLLDREPLDNRHFIPAITDQATLQWALQKGLGDTLEYRDGRGQGFQVQIVATLAGSILQGSVLISERHFIEKFPAQSGYRFFLIDAPPTARDAVAQELSRALQDRGLEVTSASRRLAEFQAVENTYLSIFQALGGLGLLLGSAGLAIVVARNVLERRAEFGLLEAIGFRPAQLRRLVFAEHRWLIVFGLSAGIASAVLAVWPGLHERSGGFPVAEMALLVGGLVFGCVFWAWLATRLALRGSGIGALRGE